MVCLGIRTGPAWLSPLGFHYPLGPAVCREHVLWSAIHVVQLQGTIHPCQDSLWFSSPSCDQAGKFNLGAICKSSFPHSSVGKESACNAGDLGSIPGSGRSPGEGTGNPLQYSCLENSMDRGTWQAAVHGVTKSRTRLKRLSTQPVNNAKNHPCLFVLEFPHSHPLCSQVRYCSFQHMPWTVGERL